MIPKMMWKPIEIYHKKYDKVSDVGSHCWSRLSNTLEYCVFLFPTWFSEPLGQHPLGPIVASTRAPCSKCRRFQSRITILRKQITPTTPSKKQARIQQRITYCQSKQIICYLYCLIKPHKFEATGLPKNGSAQLPKR